MGGTGRRVGPLVAAVLALGVGVGAASGHSTSGIPLAATPPSVSGLYVGQTLTATPGVWSSDTPVTTSLQWVRILPGGGKQPIAGATGWTYTVTQADVGSHFQVQVKAQNASGPNWVNSDTSAVVVGPTVTKLGDGSSSVAASSVSLPDRFVVHSVTFSSPLKAGGTVTATITVTDTLGNVVSGALVRTTVVPFDAAAQPAATHTGSDGTATVTLKAGHVPVSGGAAINVSVLKDGGDPLADVSASRLVRLPVGS